MALVQEKYYTEDDYYNLPENIRAELIDGELIYNQAAPSRIHQALLGDLYTLIHNYIRSKKRSCHVYPAPFAVKLDEKRNTIVEPDISVICDKDKLTDRGCTGAPDWIIEIISPGTSSHDYVRKLALYEAAGVREYWIADPGRENIFVYYMEENKFSVESYTFQDCVTVNIYGDFSIDFAVLEL